MNTRVIIPPATSHTPTHVQMALEHVRHCWNATVLRGRVSEFLSLFPPQRWQKNKGSHHFPSSGKGGCMSSLLHRNPQRWPASSWPLLLDYHCNVHDQMFKDKIIVHVWPELKGNTFVKKTFTLPIHLLHVYEFSFQEITKNWGAPCLFSQAQYPESHLGSYLPLIPLGISPKDEEMLGVSPKTGFSGI